MITSVVTYEVQNTGWTDGTSWFCTSRGRYQTPIQNYDEAKAIYNKQVLDNVDTSIKHRIVKKTTLIEILDTTVSDIK